jgi:hypothetical protein
MGAQTSDVGYRSATTGRGGGGPQSPYGHVEALKEEEEVVLVLSNFLTEFIRS